MHQTHDQLLELSHHVATHLLLPLEDLDEVVEVLVDANGEAELAVDLLLALGLSVVLLVDGSQVNLLGKFGLEI